MLASAEGRNRSVYDGGCSDCLMYESIPGKELVGVGAKVAKGPFSTEAIGGVRVVAMVHGWWIQDDEWKLSSP